jgi:Sigma-70, region 4
MVNTWASWRRRRWWGERPSEAVPDRQARGDLATEVIVRIAVRSALKSLTARQRTVLVLRVFDDLTETQVANVLDCAVGTITFVITINTVNGGGEPWTITSGTKSYANLHGQGFQVVDNYQGSPATFVLKGTVSQNPS